MSHFSVAVFHTKDQSVESLLAPYDENIQVEPYIEFTRQQAIDYARQHYKDCKDMSDEECWKIMADGRRTDPDGNLYSTYNPNSKWDWWEVGGRFKNQLQVGKHLASEAYVEDIDFSRDEESYNNALDFWDVLMSGKPKTPGKDYMTLFSNQYYLDYYGDRETYAKYMSHFRTYAVITPDGKWYAEGNMGWFGCSSATPEEFKKWCEHYKEIFLDNADPKWILTIVDCHI